MTGYRKNSGQVLTEYAVMVVIAVLLGWGLLVLCRTIFNDNEETIEFISGNVP